ncbi:outer membrane beta-barrel family protein [Pseudozobellia sp. WGM2]|uniref:outer membrane beta-barrel family protein n=1 Tax=Pseudozobellia sp. WGM2 TaxID=2787625 RepID=UPI001AE0D6EC|nr:outer membrane beta-barrel family protein [Pseudozobellia sp. WGM2]
MKSYKNNFIILIVIFCATLLGAPAKAQSEATAEIDGKITTVMNEPLPYVSLVIFKVSDSSMVKGAMSDDLGSFLIEKVPAGTYYVAASILGFKTYNSAIFEIAPNEKKEFGTLQLEEESFELEGVTVTSTKPLIQNKVDRVVLNIENSVLATGNTAMDILQKAPGVTVDNGVLSLIGKSNVLILINGRQTYLSPEQLQNLLDSTQSSVIESIEIMTNPSAKYDAAGNAGIINIKMKKNRDAGTNVSVNLGNGQGSYIKTNGGVALNHKNEVLNIFANYDYSDNQRFQTIDIDRSTSVSGQTVFFNSSSFEKNRFKIHNFKVGADVDLSPKSTLGFIISGNFVNGNSRIVATTDIGGRPEQIDSTNLGATVGKYPNKYITYNLNYKVQLDTVGTDLRLSYDYSNSRRNEGFDFSNRFLDENRNEYRPDENFRNLTPQDADIYVGKVNFTHPFTETSKIEAGLKYSSVETDNILQYDILQDNGSYVNDERRSNQFIYTEKIGAAYINYNIQLGSYDIQTGLRAERTVSTGNSITDENVVDRTYTDLFPTLFIQKKINDLNVINASYGRRIDRPNYSSLNPFVYYIDQYTFRFGNPFLKPQYTDSYSIGYLLKNKYKFDLSYSNTKDAIAYIILTDPESRSISQTDANLNGFSSYSLNVNAPIKVTNWWGTYNNVSVYYNQYRSNEIEGALLQLEKLAWQASTNHTFTIDNRTSAELSATYLSPNVYGVFNIKSRYTVDMGVSRQFFDNKLNVKLALSDIFNTWGKRTIFSNLTSSGYNIDTDFDSTVVRFSVSYKFGNIKLKSTDKKGGAEEEKNRLY